MNPEAVGISRSALALLLNLMNTPRMESAVDYLNSSGVFDEVLAARLLSPVNSGQTTICVDGKDRELIRNPDGPDYRYFSEAVGWVDVSANGICRFRLDPQRVLALIRGWLDISQRQAITNLQVDAIWDLGDMWVGKRRLAVLFMRRAIPEPCAQFAPIMSFSITETHNCSGSNRSPRAIHNGSPGSDGP
jgi:hypothetical protein